VHDLGRLQVALDGILLTRGSIGYDAARRPAMARYRDVHPMAVVQCASVRDVAATIDYARATGIDAVPRGGGHCFAGRSSTEGLVLDLERLNAIVVDENQRATIGAGARLGQIYDALHEHARTIPGGCGATVGIAGLTLGGGLGLLGRVHGLTCDRLVSAQVVLADGRMVECDAEREPELFWALRGAGGGQFGVVTSLVFATVADPRATGFELCWPDTAAAEVIAAWLSWAPAASDDITANLTVVAEPGRPLRVVVFGAALRDTGATSAVLHELVVEAGTRPEAHAHGGMAYRDLKRSLADLDPGTDSARVTTSRSEFFARSLPGASIAALLNELTSEPNGRRELNFTVLGGAYDRVAPDATAFVHRGEQFLLEHVTDGSPHWAERSWAITHPHGSGRVYPNFPDPLLTEWADAYHGDNLARLVAVKQSYDPDRFFHFPQGI
jgi:FAD/FMN-containing dehydrogenase